MNILILGLPGTGKATLCNNIANQLNLTYVTDYEILKLNNITFDDSLQIQGKDYFEVFLNYFKQKDVQNYIFDFNFSISPNNLKNLNDFMIVYLGFADIDEKKFKSKMKGQYANLSEEEFDERIQFLILISEKYKKECEVNNIKWISINNEKQLIINKLQKELIDDFCNFY